MGIACLFLTPSVVGFGWRALFSIGAGVGCGIAFGKNFPNRFRKKMSSIVDQLYDGDTNIDVPPPPEKELRYPLPCSWKRNENFSVGGVLYIGPLGLFFAPHKMNLPRDRSVFAVFDHARIDGPFQAAGAATNATAPSYLASRDRAFHSSRPESGVQAHIRARARIAVTAMCRSKDVRLAE
jgi:hypothetical protein